MIKHVHNIDELMFEISDIAYDKIKEAKNEAEYAFALGMLNVANVVVSSKRVNKSTKYNSLCIDYEETKRLFKEAEKEVAEEEDRNFGKLNEAPFKDIFPDFFKEIDKMIDKKLNKANQQKNKKE